MARKILLADDSVTAQNMGRRILSDAGYDVTTVNNGSAALKKIAESKPDLIVLDVYMPGYGGLEVCQRLREAPETARIPVLLTVGKLEPFKADEARRVRADGFIVKPFEASELLTALTKLEDKIVPQSQPTKPSRFAKALAGVDDFASPKEFGDSETGWKNRLSIPPPHSKARGAAPEEPSPAVASVREETSSEESKPAEMKSGLEEALLSALPHDVTAEEIAAIKAAAAAFSASSDESRFAAQPDSDQASALIQHAVAIVEEPSGEAGNESIAFVGQTESSANTEQSTIAEAVSANAGPAETVAPAAAIVAESASDGVLPGTEAEAGKLADDEVTAALASLAPGNGHGDAVASNREAGQWEVGSREQVPVTMALAGAAEQFSGPRWIAELVAVREDESTLVLEQEMEKAYAAFAAADAARMSFASSAEHHASLQLAEAPVFNSEAAYSAVEPISNSENAESQPPEPAAQPAMSSEDSAAAEAGSGEVPVSSTLEAVSEGAVGDVTETAAYAAAASANSGASEGMMNAEAWSQSNPVVEPVDSGAPAPEHGGGQGESELAAAWANWRQIRESVIGSQLSSQIAETVTERKETESEAQPESEVQSEAAPATEEESSEISSIVDSVLADLKPKLMAEIAKKIGKEKKK